MYVDGGFVQVADNVISVLTNRAIPAKSLDAAVAQEQLRSALASRAAGEQELAIRERLISQARGQLRVARRAARDELGAVIARRSRRLNIQQRPFCVANGRRAGDVGYRHERHRANYSDHSAQAGRLETRD